MKIATFRKNVQKTVNVKGTKLGLRTVSKNTARTQIAAGAVQLGVHVTALLSSLTNYLLGLQMNQQMIDDAGTALGDIGYDLAIISRPLKVKLPTSTKKSKLVGTRSAALLQMTTATSEVLKIASTGLFTEPSMKTEKKMVVMPQKGGVKEERDVQVINAELDKAQETVRQEQLKPLVESLVDVYWKLCYDILKTPPTNAFDEKMERLKVQYPSVVFDDDSTDEDKPKKTKKAKQEAVPA